jgi:hypothetical protein
LETIAEEIKVLCVTCEFTSSLFHDSIIECNSATPGDATFRTQLLAKPVITTSIAIELMEAWVLGTTFLEPVMATCGTPLCFDPITPPPETTESSALSIVTTVLIYIITFVISLTT